MVIEPREVDCLGKGVGRVLCDFGWELGFRGTEGDNCDGEKNAELGNKLLHRAENRKKGEDDLNDKR